MINNVKEMILKHEESYITSNLKATYYIDREGNQYSFGYEEGCRSNDHRIIFSVFENIKYNDFETLIKKIGLLPYMPESNDILILKDIEISKEQKDFIKKYNIEVIEE